MNNIRLFLCIATLSFVTSNSFRVHAEAKCSSRGVRVWRLAKKGAEILSRTMVRDFILSKDYLLWCDNGVRKGESAYSNMRSAYILRDQIIITMIKKDKFRNRDKIVLLSCKETLCLNTDQKRSFVHRLNKKIKRKNKISHQKTQVLSDVDDTIICSLKDNVCNETLKNEYWIKSHDLYPGALTLQRELATRPGQSKPDLGLILLSARFIEPFISQAYSKGPVVDGAKRVGWRVDGIMHGHAADQVNLQKNKALGDRKFSNLKRLALMGMGEATDLPLHKGRVASDKTTDYIFFGDNGEGDAMAGKLMLKSIYPTEGKMKAVFIHCLKNCASLVDSERFITFDNYAEATMKALVRNLITKEAAGRVLESIRGNSDFKKCQTDSSFLRKAACQKLTRSTNELAAMVEVIN